MQIDVATRACVKRMPSDASASRRGVRTILLPAAPIESQRVSSITRTTTFIGLLSDDAAMGSEVGARRVVRRTAWDGAEKVQRRLRVAGQSHALPGLEQEFRKFRSTDVALGVGSGSFSVGTTALIIIEQEIRSSLLIS